MTEVITYPHIAGAGDSAAHLVRFPRIRVVDVVLPYLAHGWSADELQRQFPHLTLGEIHSCLGFYFDNQAEIEKLITGEQELASQLRAGFTRTALGQRLMEATRK